MFTEVRTHPGWYVDATATQFRAVTIRDLYLQINSTPLIKPGGENLLYNRVMHRWGRTFVGGIGHVTDTARIYDGEVWREFGKAFGPRGIAFDKERGLFFVCHPNNVVDVINCQTWEVTQTSAPVGSIGIRWIKDDGVIVISEETYSDSKRGLWEYTDFGDVAIGQGKDTGVVVRFKDDGILRLLEDGEIRFVNVDREGDLFAISYVSQLLNTAVTWYGTLSDLKTLPQAPWTLPHIPPIVTPPPVIPVPTPSPSVSSYLISGNKKYKLVVQDDGNLVLYTSAGVPLWASNTNT